MKKVVVTLLVVLVLAVAGVVFIAYSGVFNVAATWHDPAPVAWFLSTTRDHSVEARSEHLEVPSLDSPQMINTGFEHYNEMCVGCHGAPGVDRSEIGKGLNPLPPDLGGPRGLDREEAAEFFWTIKNGIRMTGMPAFGPTHTDEQIWDIVAFVNTLPKISAESYARMAREAGIEMPGEHEHGEESHEGASGAAAGEEGHEHGSEAHEHGSEGHDHGE